MYTTSFQGHRRSVMYQVKLIYYTHKKLYFIFYLASYLVDSNLQLSLFNDVCGRHYNILINLFLIFFFEYIIISY